MDLGLQGKVAMVAGASKGLGFAIAQSLATEGASISIASRNAEAIEAAAERIRNQHTENVLGCAADVSSGAAIQRWHEATVARFGAVDLLVTNSGGPPAGTFSSLDDGAWQAAFELLVLSAVRLLRQVLPSMVARKTGSIVLLTSSSVKEPIANLTLSNVLRASVSALGKTLANEYAMAGIRVNQMVPGRFATDRVRELDEIASKKKGITVEQQQNAAMANIPMGRYGNADEFARAVTFVLSDAASFITGATLQVDGGQIRSVL